MAVLKYWNGSAWVALGTGTLDQVAIQDGQPADVYEIWIDTDEDAGAAWPAATPRGRVSGLITTSMADLTTFTTEADITGLTFTWTADATRMYRTTVQGISDQITNAGTHQLFICDGSNTHLRQANQVLAIASLAAWNLQHWESGISGSVTRKVRITSSAASGRIRQASPTSFPWTLLVEDIGAA